MESFWLRTEGGLAKSGGRGLTPKVVAHPWGESVVPIQALLERGRAQWTYPKARKESSKKKLGEIFGAEGQWKKLHVSCSRCGLKCATANPRGWGYFIDG